MNKIEDFMKFVTSSGPSEDELMLMNIIYVMDEMLRLLKKHNKYCNLLTKKDSGKGCDCGADAVKQTYVEIHEMLSGPKEH